MVALCIITLCEGIAVLCHFRIRENYSKDMRRVKQPLLKAASATWENSNHDMD